MELCTTVSCCNLCAGRGGEVLGQAFSLRRGLICLPNIYYYYGDRRRICSFFLGKEGLVPPSSSLLVNLICV